MSRKLILTSIVFSVGFVAGWLYFGYNLAKTIKKRPNQVVNLVYNMHKKDHEELEQDNSEATGDDHPQT